MSVFVLSPVVVLHHYTQRRHYDEHCMDGCYCFPCLDKKVYFDHVLCSLYNEDGQSKEYQFKDVENLINSYGYRKLYDVAGTCNHRVLTNADRMACCFCCCPYRNVGNTVIANPLRVPDSGPDYIVAPKNIYKFNYAEDIPCRMTAYSKIQSDELSQVFTTMKVSTPDGVAVRIGPLNTSPVIGQYQVGEIVRVCLPKQVRVVGEVSRVKVFHQGQVMWCGYEKNNLPLLIDVE